MIKSNLSLQEDQLNYKRYKNLIDNLDDVVFQTDEMGNWIFLNHSWERIMGYEISEVIGKPFYNFLHPDDVERNFELLEPLIRGEKTSSSHEIRYLHKSGEIVFVKAFSILVKDENGAIIGTSGTLQDITMDMQNRNMVKLLSNNINDLISMYDMDGIYKYVSPSFSAITGYLPRELLGKNRYTFFHPDDIDRIRNNNQKLINSDKDYESYITFRFRVKSGGAYKWFESNTKVISDEYGKSIRLVTSSRNVDLRVKAEEQILKSLQIERELNLLKSSFVNLASHEFKIPLAIMSSSIELIEGYLSKNENPSVLRHTKIILLEIARLNNLLEEVLIIGKIESQVFICQKEVVNLVELVQEVIQNLEEIQEDHQTAILKINGTHRMVNADPFLLRIAITNVISNAFKYSAGKRQPLVHLTFNENNYQIKVTDFGIGIPIEAQNKIFVTFFRAENVRLIKGTGLGMFITKNFIEMHAGDISFKSKLGKTEFTINLN
ncbi:PAS domain S-box-containing protein [Pedobacter sp. CG_S7]|uniref:sensor histidine kinase n=1 Tax=Pedobacter sp. CG_S7 TaxID=3143930 RepID=UPI00339A2462